MTLHEKSPDTMAQLRTAWVASGHVPARSDWHALTGGRTNPVWRIGDGAQALVCKLFTRAGSTPLFQNDPAAEILALHHLQGTGLAPLPVAALSTEVGESVVYAHVTGTPWHGDVGSVATLLARLHRQPLPPGLPYSGQGADRLLRQGRDILGTLTDTQGLEALRPRIPPLPDAADVFLHGDAVAGNILVDGADLTLIDWQCPSRGDACDDLAIFLSPAMQAVNGNPPLSPAQEAAFLLAYGDARVTRRYQALAPAYHWRMAAYCLWKAERGDAEYAKAAALERAHLQQG